MKSPAKILLLGLLILGSPLSRADEILVAVASNFTAPMTELAQRFEAQTGHTVQLAFGSSGRFFAQISNGAPYQVFLSADQDKPRRLEETGLAVSGSRFTYAIGRLALWSADAGRVLKGPEALSAEFNRLALANPRLAPYGQAAVQVLERLGMRDATESRWVQGENIAQAFQFVQSGNAELGFIAMSQIMHDGGVENGNAWVVPQDLYSPIRQDAVLMQQAQSCQACIELLTFMNSVSSWQLIKSYGYTVDDQQ